MKQKRTVRNVVALLCVTLVASAVVAGSAVRRQPYEYPVVPGTAAWMELNGLDEMIAACAVDENRLEAMTTPALLETVLHYPLLINIYAFNSVEQGVDSVSSYFAGLPMLLARPDALSCMEAYAQSEPADDAEQMYLKTLTQYLTEA